MRERYLEVFDREMIDYLHGDRIISEYAPDGRSSDTIFSVSGHSPGIKVGTAISTLIKSANVGEADRGVWYRDFHQSRAGNRRAALTAAAGCDNLTADYTLLQPSLPLGLPFKRMSTGDDYLTWPKLPELFPASFPGVTTSRDDFLVAIDRETLEARLAAYFDPLVSHEEMRARYPSVMTASARYQPERIRDALRKRGLLKDNIVRYAYRPFDERWLYWEPETKLLDEKREEYWPHVKLMNRSIVLPQRHRREWSPPVLATEMTDANIMDGKAAIWPLILIENMHSAGYYDNLSSTALLYKSEHGVSSEEIFLHIVSTMHSSAYCLENYDGLRMDWPRVPLPEDGEALRASGRLGRELAALLDPETPVPGVTIGALRPDLSRLAVPAKTVAAASAAAIWR